MTTTIDHDEEAKENSKNGKARRSDEVPFELREAQVEKNLNNLTKIQNKIYQTGTMPEERLKSLSIPIPKRTYLQSYEQYRIISLTVHPLKVLIKIIQIGIYRTTRQYPIQVQRRNRDPKNQFYINLVKTVNLDEEDIDSTN